MIALFIIIQSILLIFMLFHDWIPIPPFNDIEALKKSDSTFYRLLGSLVNGMFVLIPLIITLRCYQQTPVPLIAMVTVLTYYLLLTIGTILSWWIPYYWGSSQKLKEEFSKFKNTHHFLPARGDNVIPNTLHVILHLQVWACLAISLYFLIIHI